jgi:hypothetical protein
MVSNQPFRIRVSSSVPYAPDFVSASLSGVKPATSMNSTTAQRTHCCRSASRGFLSSVRTTSSGINERHGTQAPSSRRRMPSGTDWCSSRRLPLCWSPLPFYVRPDVNERAEACPQGLEVAMSHAGSDAVFDFLRVCSHGFGSNSGVQVPASAQDTRQTDQALHVRIRQSPPPAESTNSPGVRNSRQ